MGIGLCVGCAHQPTGPKNELTEPFDLVCTPAKGESVKVTFHFIPSDKDGVIAQRMNDTELVDFQTQTYENALLWKNDSETFAVDRFTGQLIRKPSGERYFCAKRGRRVF
jgi:hypothetical protein